MPEKDLKFLKNVKTGVVVYWTPLLDARKDLVPCTVDGKELVSIPEAVPEKKRSPRKSKAVETETEE
jgi:hypothetical protein